MSAQGERFSTTSTVQRHPPTPILSRTELVQAPHQSLPNGPAVASSCKAQGQPRNPALSAPRFPFSPTKAIYLVTLGPLHCHSQIQAGGSRMSGREAPWVSGSLSALTMPKEGRQGELEGGRVEKRGKKRGRQRDESENQQGIWRMEKIWAFHPLL